MTVSKNTQSNYYCSDEIIMNTKLNRKILMADPFLRYLAVILLISIALAAVLLSFSNQKERQAADTNALLQQSRNEFRLLKQLSIQDLSITGYAAKLQIEIDKLSVLHNNSNYFSAMSDLADRSSIKMVSENYLTPDIRAGYSQKVAKLRLKASYSELKDYLDGLQELPFITKVEKLNIDHAAGTNELTVVLEVTAIMGS